MTPEDQQLLDEHKQELLARLQGPQDAFAPYTEAEIKEFQEPQSQTPDPLPLVPAIFKEQVAWVTYESKDSKAPIISGTTLPARSNDPNTWVGFQTLSANITAGIGYKNSGFMMDGARTGYLVGVDIDGCWTGTGVTEKAQAVLDFFKPLGTYAEWTPNQGLHVWFRGSVANQKFLLYETPGYRNKAQKVEVFSDGLYFTMTGNRLPGFVSEVPELSSEQVKELLALLESLEVGESSKSKQRTKSQLVPGTLRFEEVPAEPDPSFRKLFDVVGWEPFEQRVQKMADERFHNFTLSDKLSFCPMPGHAPRGPEVPFTSKIFGTFGDGNFVKCFGCGFSGDLIKAVSAFDAGEEGGKITYGNAYECGRAVCLEYGLNPDEYFPSQNSLAVVAGAADQLHAAVAAVEAATDKEDKATPKDRRITAEGVRTLLGEVMSGRDLPWTHGAGADFFEALFGENFLYAIYGQKGHWMNWNSHMWHDGNVSHIRQRMDTLLKRIRTHVIPTLRATDETTYAALRALDKSCASATFMSGLMTMLQSKRLIEFEKFDPEDGPALLNFLNGTYELATGVSRESRREDMLTQTLAVAYSPGVACPNWIKFLENSFPDPDVREFLHRFFGYMLEGTNSQKVVAFFHGYGDNGKTILIRILMAIFGYKSDAAYGKAASWESFAESKGGIRNDIARLFNARAVFCDESEQGMVLKESLFKALSGYSPITTRFLYGENFTFISRFVFVLATNRMPRILGGDGATWNRILKVPMTEKFPKGHPKRIENLDTILMGEREGIVQWMLEGYRKYKLDGLKVPKQIIDASAEYRENSDVIEWFLAENVQKDAEHKERFDDVYNQYTEWCRTKNEKEQSRDGLIDILKSRDYKVTRALAEQGKPLYAVGFKLLRNELTLDGPPLATKPDVVF